MQYTCWSVYISIGMVGRLVGRNHVIHVRLPILINAGMMNVGSYYDIQLVIWPLLIKYVSVYNVHELLYMWW